MMSLRLRSVLALLLLVVLSACGQNAAVESTEVRASDDAVVLDEATMNGLETYEPGIEGRLVFANETPQLANVGAGDVLVSRPTGAAPRGFLRRVLSKTSEGDSLVLETEQATLDDVIEEGTILVQRELRPSDVAEVRLLAEGGEVRFNQGLAPQQAEYPWNFEFDEVVVGDADDPNNQLRVNGSFQIDPALELKLHYGLTTGLEEFRAVAGLDQRADVAVTGRFLQDVEQKIDLVDIDLHQETIMAGPIPIVIDIDLLITIGARGQVTATVTASAIQTASLQAGAHYRKTTGWEDVSSSDLDFSFQPPSLQGGVQAEALAGANLEVRLYDVVGPRIYADAVVGVDAAIPRDPVWILYGGVDAGFGLDVNIPILGGGISSGDRELMSTRQELGRADNVAPQVDIVGGDRTVSLNQIHEVSVEVSDLEDGDACCAVTWASDVDGPLGNGVTLRTTFAQEGVRTVTATAVDSSGLSSTASVQIDVANDPPDPFIQVPELDEFRATLPYAIRASVRDPNEPGGYLTCADVVLEGSAGVTVDPQSSQDSINCAYEVVFPTLTSPSEVETVTLTVTGTDGQGAQATQDATVSVVPAPETAPPVLGSFEVQRDDGSLVSDHGIVDANRTGDFPLTLSASASDADGPDPLTYTFVITDEAGEASVTFASGTSASVQVTAAEMENFRSQLGTTDFMIYVVVDDGETEIPSLPLHVDFRPVIL